MSNGSRSGGGGGSRRRDVPEAAVQDKLALIRARRAERLANRGAELAGRESEADEEEDEDEDESTQAINLADLDLGNRGRPARAAAPAPPSRPPAVDDDDDDDGEDKTAAFDLDFGALADLRARRPPAPAAPPAPSRPAPPPARPAPPPARPAPPPAAFDDDDDDSEDKTAAFSLDDIGDLRGLARRAPEPAPAPRPAPVAAAPPSRPAPPPDDEDEDEDEGSTQAFSLDDIAPPRRSAPPLAPAVQDLDESERTMAVSLDDFMPSPAAAPPPAAGADQTLMVDIEADLQLSSRRGGARSEPAMAAAPPPATVVVVGGNDIGRVYTLTRDVTLVGRGTDADFVVNDASASRRHFNVVRTSAGWKLVDLGSGNGTRVDGQRVKEMALRDGMKIECGTTALEFRQPVARQEAVAAPPPRPRRDFAAEPVDSHEEKTRMGDMAALEIDPDWEARRARMRLEAQQGGDTLAQPAPAGRYADILERPRRKGGAGKVAAIVGVLMVLGGGGFVAADKVAGLGIIFPKETAGPVSGEPGTGPGGVTTGPSAEDARKAESLVTDGEEAYADKRWHAARKLFSEALALNPRASRANGDPVDEAVFFIDQELKALRALVDARKAVSEERYGDALALLRGVPADTAYHREAQGSIGSVQDELVAQKLGLARQAEDKGELDAAKREIGEALAVAKDDPQALAIQLSLERATGADAENVETNDEDPAKRVLPEKAAKTDLSPGLALYAKGDFMAAADFFDGVQEARASRSDRARAKALAAAITQFEGAFSRGEAALANNDTAEAVKHLRLAKKFDLAVSGAFHTHVNEALASTYAAQAKAAFDDGRVAAAGGAARRALALHADNAEARTIAESTQKTARAWLDEARSISADDPDKAMNLLHQSLAVLPVKDEAYAAAYAQLMRLATKVEE